jgi:Arc/MetJ family transcription regulator
MHKEAHMRTTLDIPENLIAEAMQLTSIKTKTALIIRALEELVRKNKIAEIKKYKGRINLDVDLDVLRNRK